MAIFGKIGQTLGLGSTANVLGNIFGNRANYNASEQPPVNIQNTIETASSGEETGFRTVPIFPQQQANPLGTAVNVIRNLPMSDRVRDVITGFGGGAILDNALDIFSGSQNVCSTSPMSKPYSINKMNNCITVTRKQQARLKEMVSIVGLEATADAVGLSTDDLVLLLLKRFKARGRGITAASMRTTKRTIRQIKSLHADVSSMAGRRTPVRRTAAVKQVKYSN